MVSFRLDVGSESPAVPTLPGQAADLLEQDAPFRGADEDRPGRWCNGFCGSTDIGQGSDSVLATIVAEEFAIDPEQVIVVTADTDLTPVDLGSYSSRVTLMTGNAAIEACRPLKEKLLSAAAEVFQCTPNH